jgi:hypothetical protein
MQGRLERKMADDYFTLQTMIGRAFRIHPPQAAGRLGRKKWPQVIPGAGTKARFAGPYHFKSDILFVW